jgi:thiamine-monophosphate kinase
MSNLLNIEESERLTPIGQIGVSALIERITAQGVQRQPSTHLGVGDDAACIQPVPGEEWVVTTDMMVEGVHFDTTYFPLMHLGYKVVVAGISDVVAMNAVPRQILLGLAISAKYTVEAVEELYKGVHTACAEYGVDLVGGDVTSSTGGLTLSVTAMGSAPADRLVARGGARKGDLICVSGDLGAAFMGLNLLEREKRIYREDPGIQPDFGAYEYLLRRQIRPAARTDMAAVFEAFGCLPTSLIDLSAGLGRDIEALCRASGVGCRLYEDRIPIDPLVHELATQFQIDPTLCALSGGEDYELLFTLPFSMSEKLEGHPDITMLGYITDSEDGQILVSHGGQEHELNKRIYAPEAQSGGF